MKPDALSPRTAIHRIIEDALRFFSANSPSMMLNLEANIRHTDPFDFRFSYTINTPADGDFDTRFLANMEEAKTIWDPQDTVDISPSMFFNTRLVRLSITPTKEATECHSLVPTAAT